MDSTANKAARMRADSINFDSKSAFQTPTRKRQTNLRFVHEAAQRYPGGRHCGLRYMAEKHPHAELRQAALDLLDRDKSHGVLDGMGGYRWVGDRLQWVPELPSRDFIHDGGIICDPFPESLEIPVGTSSYSLHLCNGHIRFDDGQYVNGVCDGIGHSIYIANTYAAPMRLVTTWHEIGHAILFECGDISGVPQKLDHEQVCDIISRGMAGIGPLKYAEIAAFVTDERFAYPRQPLDITA
jgi:hypothetical protein